jgi:hypothetical protein
MMMAFSSGCMVHMSWATFLTIQRASIQILSLWWSRKRVVPAVTGPSHLHSYNESLGHKYKTHQLVSTCHPTLPPGPRI